MKKKISWVKLAGMLLLLFLVVVTVGCAERNGTPADTDNHAEQEEPEAKTTEKVQLFVGSKETTEQLIMGQISVLLLEEAGFEVLDKTGLGDTRAVRKALEEEEIDLYWEYTGTAWKSHLGYEDTFTDSWQGYDRVQEEDRQNGVAWLDYTPFNNTYALLMRQEDAEQLKISSISDLAEAIEQDEQPLGEWVLATNHQYVVVEDKLSRLKETYGLEFDEVQVMDQDDIYRALKDGDVLVGVGMATSGFVAGFDLVSLVDDQQFHPAYNCAPTLREETLEQHPEIEETLNQVISLLDDKTMSRLNAAVELDGQEPVEVAREWLETEGLL